MSLYFTYFPHQDLVPVAEERANFGKVVKKGIRSMWALEYEIVDIQEAFAKQMGDIDIANLTDDFIEEMLLQSKPLQGVLHAIRERQKVRIDRRPRSLSLPLTYLSTIFKDMCNNL